MKIKIFISKPTDLNPHQKKFWNQLKKILLKDNFLPTTLGENEFYNSTPLVSIRRMMTNCGGAIILGFRQIHIFDGIAKEGTPKERLLKGVEFPTPWNQIEAAMAYMVKLPLLIYCQKNVEGGVFDKGNTDLFIHSIVLSEKWLKSEKFKQPYTAWKTKVRMANTQKRLTKTFNIKD